MTNNNNIFEQIEDVPTAEKPVDATYFCPNQMKYGIFQRMVWIHDLRCAVCNNTDVNWCPKCQVHFKIRGSKD